jgi:hypothetical protein
MDSEEFVRAVKRTCSDNEGEENVRSLRNSPGRRPQCKAAPAQKWFHQLDPGTQAGLVEALNDAAEGPVFGLLCILDGMGAIEDGPNKGRLELYYVNGEQRILLNDPIREELHNLFKACAASIEHRRRSANLWPKFESTMACSANPIRTPIEFVPALWLPRNPGFQPPLHFINH